MGVGVKSPLGGYGVSGSSGILTGEWLDLRNSNGTFLYWLSASAKGGNNSGFASSNILLQHSFDKTAITNIVLITASASGANASLQTAVYSGGPYGYLRNIVTVVYSAAGTGTGVVYSYILPGLL